MVEHFAAIQPDSDHVANFHGDRSTDLRESVSKRTSGLKYKLVRNYRSGRPKRNKELSYCWETVRRENMPRIAEMDVEMTT